MMNFQSSVFVILFNGSPLLVTPIGDPVSSTFLVDIDDVFILIEKHVDDLNNTFWTEFGKGKTTLSNDIGILIGEKNWNADYKV